MKNKKKMKAVYYGWLWLDKNKEPISMCFGDEEPDMSFDYNRRYSIIRVKITECRRKS